MIWPHDWRGAVEQSYDNPSFDDGDGTGDGYGGLLDYVWQRQMNLNAALAVGGCCRLQSRLDSIDKSQ